MGIARASQDLRLPLTFDIACTRTLGSSWLQATDVILPATSQLPTCRDIRTTVVPRCPVDCRVTVV